MYLFGFRDFASIYICVVGQYNFTTRDATVPNSKKTAVEIITVEHVVH
jgi:hypothetical protein